MCRPGDITRGHVPRRSESVGATGWSCTGGFSPRMEHADTAVSSTPETHEKDLEGEELERAYAESLKEFDDGDVVRGFVLRIDKDEVLVDIGYKSEGVIPLKELS